MPAPVVQFGEGFEIDRVAYELRRSGIPLKLERIPMEILFLLIERRGELVTRDDIIGKIWGKDVFLDTDNSINSAIRKIRQALKDDPESPSFIQTVTGKGYRFIALVPEPSPAVAVSETEVPQGRGDANRTVAWPDAAPRAQLEYVHTATNRRSRWGWIGASLATVALAAVIFYAYRLHEAAGTPTGSAKRTMLAVLPFANLSSDPEQEYFSDGLTEETITDLGELNPDRLGVIARTSSAAYKHTTKTIAEIGQELGVDYILEGSVRREGGVVRISAQLIRVKGQVHLWAHNYEREQNGLLAMQNELGRGIAQSVRVKLTPGYGNRTANQYVPDGRAYELYLRGRSFMNQRTWSGMEASTDYFQQAIARDPGFALAYAGLANSYLARAIQSPREFDPKAKAAALRALDLDSDLAEAHVALGTVKADFEYDWQGAAQEFKRALELNPNYPEAHSWYAWTYLTPLGRSDEAIAEMKKALALDPFSRIDNTRLGLTYFYAKRYDLAEEQLDHAIRLNPDFFVTYYHRAWLFSQLGRYAQSISELTRARQLSDDERTHFASADDAALKHAFATGQAQGYWQELLKQGEKDDPEIGEFAPPQIYARLHENERALQELQLNYEQRSPLGTLINVDPAFDSLRADPRFINLVARMGLTAPPPGP